MVDADQQQEWIERSRQGDHEAFENLIRMHQRMIHSIAYRMTGRLEDADDLAQEAFVQAYRQLGTFRGDAKFSSWLCRVAINLCLNWRKRESRRAELHRKWSDETIGAEVGNEGLDERSERIQRAINQLPAELRAAVTLTVFQEMSHGEAARALGCAETTVSWRLFMARRKLKGWLKQDLAEAQRG